MRADLRVIENAAIHVKHLVEDSNIRHFLNVESEKQMVKTSN